MGVTLTHFQISGYIPVNIAGEVNFMVIYIAWYLCMFLLPFLSIAQLEKLIGTHVMLQRCFSKKICIKSTYNAI